MSDAAKQAEPEVAANAAPDAAPDTSAQATDAATAPNAAAGEPPAELAAEPAADKAADECAADAKPVAPARVPAVPPKLVLLIDPDGSARGTVVDMSRGLVHVRLHGASSVARGEDFMKDNRIQGLLLSVSEGAAPLDFLARLRRGECRCDAGIPVVVMAPNCDATLAGQLKEFGISRFLLQPFKLGNMAHTLEQLWQIEVLIPPQKPAPPKSEVGGEVTEAGEADEDETELVKTKADGADTAAKPEPEPNQTEPSSPEATSA